MEVQSMSQLLTKDRVNTTHQRLTQVISVQLKNYWHEAEGYQKILYYTGFLLLASAAFHTVVLIVMDGTLKGDVSFRKAISFGEAFGFTAISLAWFLTFIPKKRVIWWILSGIYAVVTFVEVFLVTMQVWRGVPSHFNFSTPFDAAVFGIMGISISLHAPLILGMFLCSVFFLEAPTIFRWAITSGMLLLVTSLVFGIVMIINSSNTIGLFGQMKVPHALALHAAQVLPLLALLLSFTNLSETKRTRFVIVGVLSYSALVGITAVQAFNGHAIVDLSLPILLIFLTSAALLGITFLGVLNGLRLK